MEENIKAIINEIKPYLNSDGGDIEYVKFDKGIVYVKLQGVCSGCPHRNETIKSLVLGMLQDNIDEVEDVIAIEEA